jgi:DNA-binding transcriptional LysR family regulator
VNYFAERPQPLAPADLAQHDGILIRSPQIGRVRPWPLRNRANEQMPITLRTRMTMSDPDAACEAAQQGLGIALVATPNVLPYLESGKLIRVLPDWYVDIGTVSLYFAAQKLLPAKTRAFVDFVVAHFREQKLAQRFSAF